MSNNGDNMRKLMESINPFDEVTEDDLNQSSTLNESFDAVEVEEKVFDTYVYLKKERNFSHEEARAEVLKAVQDAIDEIDDVYGTAPREPGV